MDLTPKQLEQRRKNVEKMAELKRARATCTKGHPLKQQKKGNRERRWCPTCTKDRQFYTRLRKRLERERIFRETFGTAD